MAKDSGIGTIIGLGIAGVGVWWLGDIFGWWGGTTVATTATTPPASGIVPASTPMPTTPTPPATIKMNGSVSLVANNALKASFTINGTPQNIAVIPNGDAYNDAGQDITSQLAAIGVTPSQLYSLMTAAYQPVSVNITAGATTGTTPGSTTPANSVVRPNQGLLPLRIVRPVSSMPGGRGGAAAGMGAMVFANPGNYRRSN
jgi:hypothetical protein